MDDLKRAKVVAGISGHAAQNFVREIRGSATAESGFKQALTESTRKFVEWFDLKEETCATDRVKFPIVFCKHPRRFIDCMFRDRRSKPNNAFLRHSIDEGRGFFKGKSMQFLFMNF